MKPPKDTPQINVDISLATDVLCEKCGNATYQEVVIMKHLSDIASPTGKAGNVPIPLFACNACGHVNEQFLPPFMRKNPPVEKASVPTSTIKLVK